MSVWLVDWKYKDSISETNKALNGIDNALLFTTYFDYRNNLYQTEESNKLINSAFNDINIKKKNIYLTLINDQFLEDGRVIQKNPNVLEKILQNSNTRQAHIKQIIQNAKNYPYAGVEIDYEKIPTTLIDNYITFLKELKIALTVENLNLRVILEPRFPMDKHVLPNNISYIVMAYNLYGYHSGPGPKADYAFLDTLIKKFPNKEKNMGVALATGGFSWSNGKVTALTEQQAIKLAIDKQIKPKRDEKSGVLHFNFTENNSQITVWYADFKTLELWMQYLNKNGKYTDFSIWRTGGLTEDTLNFLNKQ